MNYPGNSLFDVISMSFEQMEMLSRHSNRAEQRKKMAARQAEASRKR